MKSTHVFMVLIGIVATFVGISCTDNGGEFDCGGQYVVVRGGDDIWGIAEKYCTGDIPAAVDAIVQIYGTDIVPGQALTLP